MSSKLSMRRFGCLGGLDPSRRAVSIARDSALAFLCLVVPPLQPHHSKEETHNLGRSQNVPFKDVSTLCRGLPPAAFPQVFFHDFFSDPPPVYQENVFLNISTSYQSLNALSLQWIFRSPNFIPSRFFSVHSLAPQPAFSDLFTQPVRSVRSAAVRPRHHSFLWLSYFSEVCPFVWPEAR